MTNRVDINKTCATCIGYKDGWCEVKQCATRGVNYGCIKWLDEEAYKARCAEIDRRLNSEKATKVNYMLTLMYTFVHSATALMERCELLMGEFIGGKEWRHERKKALNKMASDFEDVRRLYATYFEKDFVDMMTNYGKEAFDNRQYDSFGADSADFLRLALTFYDRCYTSWEAKDEAIARVGEMESDLKLFDNDFIESFRVKQK